jgi:hypothetical protein
MTDWDDLSRILAVQLTRMGRSVTTERRGCRPRVGARALLTQSCAADARRTRRRCSIYEHSTLVCPMSWFLFNFLLLLQDSGRPGMTMRPFCVAAWLLQLTPPLRPSLISFSCPHPNSAGRHSFLLHTTHSDTRRGAGGGCGIERMMQFCGESASRNAQGSGWRTPRGTPRTRRCCSGEPSESLLGIGRPL